MPGNSNPATRSSSSRRSLRLLLVGVAAGACSIAAQAQRAVKLPDEVESASVLAVQIDPATRVGVGRMPRPIERGAVLESLGLAPEQLRTDVAATYTPVHLEDAGGRLAAFDVSIVKQGERWVFWSDDVPRNMVRPSTELQATFDTQRDVRYLVDFVLDTAAQEFAVVAGDTRTSQTGANGHVAVVVAGTGRPQTVRVLPLGDAQAHVRQFTFFHAIVTPLR